MSPDFLEQEIKLAIPERVIQDARKNAVMKWAAPYIKSQRVVFQTDSYRVSDVPGYSLRFRTHEDTGEIIMGYKELKKPSHVGLIQRQEIENCVGEGFAKHEIHRQARKVWLKHPEVAYSGIRRTLCILESGKSQAELAIDLGMIYYPDGTPKARISEIEFELKQGPLEFITALSYTLQRHLLPKNIYLHTVGSKGERAYAHPTLYATAAPQPLTL